MLYEIFWKKKASKQLFKLETVTQKRIMKSVGELKDSKTWKTSDQSSIHASLDR